MASMALPPSASTARPASAAAEGGAATTPPWWPALCRSIESGRVREAAAPQQRLLVGQPAAEGLVGLVRSARAAGRIDEAMEPLGGRAVEHVAGLLEGVEGVGVEHTRPHVAVLGRRIVVAGEDVAELRRAGPHH